jgi:hypothetical protein
MHADAVECLAVDLRELSPAVRPAEELKNAKLHFGDSLVLVQQELGFDAGRLEQLLDFGTGQSQFYAKDLLGVFAEDRTGLLVATRRRVEPEAVAFEEPLPAYRVGKRDEMVAGLQLGIFVEVAEVLYTDRLDTDRL